MSSGSERVFGPLLIPELLELSGLAKDRDKFIHLGFRNGQASGDLVSAGPGRPRATEVGPNRPEVRVPVRGRRRGLGRGHLGFTPAAPTGLGRGVKHRAELKSGGLETLLATELAMGQIARLVSCGAVILSGVHGELPRSPVVTIVETAALRPSELLLSLFAMDVPIDAPIDAPIDTVDEEAAFLAMEASSDAAAARAEAALDLAAADWEFADS